jgi:thiol-disulfide isomerase/thioredoxin
MSEHVNILRRHILGAGALTAAAAGLGVSGAAADQPAPARLPSLAGATGWLNTPPLQPVVLRGKVVLVNFCTYTCINWLRTLPYVRAWAANYRAQGLVVVGVHTPEFEFEHDLANVRRALASMRVDYPVAVDNDYAVWNAFHNQYWPALYMVDAQGAIRHHQFGEGDYAQSERIIRQLLAQAGSSVPAGGPAVVEASGIEAPADWANLQSAENYLGQARTENFSSPGGAAVDQRRLYTAPMPVALNHWALAGEWTIGKRSIVLNRAGGRIAYGFHARDLHLVMGPSARSAPVRFRVSIDGAPPAAEHGNDVAEDGSGTVSEARLYQLVRQRAPIASRQFEIEFLDAGVGAYAFTFG